jgi:hypothetical protein
MFESSKDVLYLTISLCIAVFTVFSCWGIYYFVGILRNAFKISKDARNVLKKAEEVVDAVKEKIHSSASYLLLLGEAIKKILEIMSERGMKIPFKKKKNKKETEEKE